MEKKLSEWTTYPEGWIRSLSDSKLYSVYRKTSLEVLSNIRKDWGLE